MENKVFRYEDNNITFQLDSGDLMVNLTEMAKPFGKQVYERRRLPSTFYFISAFYICFGSYANDGIIP